VLRHPFSELSEEVLNHRRTVLLLGELVAAEAVHLVPGQPEAAVLGDLSEYSAGLAWSL
jgi:hypothetical protein